jgi:hypothetical protein
MVIYDLSKKLIQMTSNSSATSGTPIFARALQTNMKNKCLGLLYLANTNTAKDNCKFKVTSARE